MFTCTTWWQLFSKSVLDVLHCRVTAFNKLQNSQVIACIRWAKCVCVFRFSKKAFPEWLSGTEPFPHTPGAVVFVVFCVHMYRFAGFDKADATADIQWHCNHRPPLWNHYIPGCRYPGLLDRKKLFGHVQKSQSSALKGMQTITGYAESNGET